MFVRTLEQLRGIFHSRYSDRITRLYIDGDLLAQGCTDPALSESEVWSEVLANRGQAQIVLSLPRILRARDESYLEHLYRFVLLHPEIEGFEITSMEAMGFLKSKGYAGRLYAGAGFYLWNTQALEVWRKQLSGFCLPLELSAGEQRTLLNRGIPCEKLVYGRIPMMVTANCLAQTQGNCGGKETLVQLTDRYQKQFPVVINCSHCMNTIYNSVPLALHREWAKWKAHVDMRLDFTVESGAEVIRILDYFEGVRCGAVSPKEGKPPFDQYTTGHEKRQVE